MNFRHVISQTTMSRSQTQGFLTPLEDDITINIAYHIKLHRTGKVRGSGYNWVSYHYQHGIPLQQC